ncbi:hypothetical protein Pan216_08240 [Planctomycetes bacterium Pan216]|uniref:Carboxypeptidase regulatory-like domain-containing protein n=1 Tax=Kolteria novifilia TaxID=2527975 RepID=A0A518AZ28_9BACT|nr:hypothetical protein Pan216_08240 [Planctomycetes bacterium Pan216]
MKHLLFAGVMGVLVCLLNGCGGGQDPNRVPVFPVEGQVNYRGAPLDGAVVTFSPKQGQPTALGKTDAEGHFKLKTYGKEDGAAKGDYVVMVTKLDIQESEEIPIDDPRYGVPQPDKEDKSLIPEVYATKKSPLAATVSDESENRFNFDLTQ